MTPKSFSMYERSVMLGTPSLLSCYVGHTEPAVLSCWAHRACCPVMLVTPSLLSCHVGHTEPAVLLCWAHRACCPVMLGTPEPAVLLCWAHRACCPVMLGTPSLLSCYVGHTEPAFPRQHQPHQSSCCDYRHISRQQFFFFCLPSFIFGAHHFYV